MRPALVIAQKDLRERLRDRSAIVLGFVAPLLIATLISFAFRSAESFHATVGVVDLDRGPVATAILDVLAGPQLRNILSVRALPSEDLARRRVHSGKVQAAYVIPAGFSAAVAGRGDQSIMVLTSSDNKLSGDVARAVADAFVARLNADRMAVATALAAGAPAASATRLAALAANLDLPEGLVDRPIGAHPLKMISFYAPGMAIFFVFFGVSFGSRSFFTEKRSGTLDRLAAAPARPGDILAGKALSIFVYGAASMAVMVVFTTTLFGARWGTPLAAAALSAAMVAAVVCLTALVITVARTDRQADGLASMIIFGLALLGGNFVPISNSPALIRRLALITPNGWALRGFVDLATGSGRLATVVTPILAIGGFCVVVGGLAASRARRLVVQ